MKKYILSIFAFASALAFTACTSDGLVNGGSEGDENLGSSYISIAINTPTESGMGSRAENEENAENDHFDDGLAAEYRVREAVLVLFKQAGTSENDYTFFGAYDIPVNPTLYNPVNDQITSRGVSAVKVANLTNDIYALVIANPNGAVKIENGKLMINGDGTAKEVTTNNTFADFNGEFAKILSGTNNLLNQNSTEGLQITMCNTPYFAKTGTFATGPGNEDATDKGKMITLSKIDASQLFANEQAALNSDEPTAEIFLERAVAKVTLSANAGTMTGKDDEAHKYTIKGWLLDNTNASTYLVRNVEGASLKFGYISQGVATTVNGKYRFVGYKPFAFNATDPAPAPGTNDMYRYYWAKDPNYSTPGTFNVVQKVEKVDAGDSDNLSNNVTFLPIDVTRPQYCFENTFDVDHQIWSETTRVLIRAQFNSGQTFYTINQDDSELYSEDGLKAKLVASVITNMNGLKGAARLSLVEGVEINAGNWSTYFTIDYSNVNHETMVVTPEVHLTTAGENAIQHYNDPDGTETRRAARAAVAELFSDVRAQNSHIQLYEKGICYYQARIKHFGDDLTPWNTWEQGAGVTVPKSGNTSTIYPTGEKNYLGRYGMVRNNWYNLKVSAIKRIGSPVIPAIDGTDGGTPDDELDSYISLRINIMSWAKRTQNIEF